MEAGQGEAIDMSYQPEITFNTEEILRMQTGGFSSFTGAEAGFVTFYMRSVIDPVASEATGKIVERQEEFCRIPIIGSKDIWDQPVRDSDKRKYEAAYKSFKAGQKGVELGHSTALREWDFLNESKRQELERNGFQVVEQIAQCSDANMHLLGSESNMIKKQAVAFLGAKHKAVSNVQLKTENAELKDKIANQATLIEGILKRLDEAEKGAKPAKK
jgi:hypothetical protein